MSRRKSANYIDAIVDEINIEKIKGLQFGNSENKFNYDKISRKFKDFLVNFNTLIMWSKRTNEDVDTGVAIRILEHEIGFKLNGSTHKVTEILKSHKDNMLIINQEKPYPITHDKITHENYLDRYNKITELRSDTAKKLEEVIK